MGILTEEELKDISARRVLKPLGVNWDTVDKIISSHRNLLSANAELSFNNQKAKADIREHYLGLKSVKGINQIGADHAMLAIENVLDTLKIKIEDVNA